VRGRFVRRRRVLGILIDFDQNEARRIFQVLQYVEPYDARFFRGIPRVLQGSLSERVFRPRLGLDVNVNCILSRK